MLSIDKISEGMTGEQSADLIYNNDNKAYKTASSAVQNLPDYRNTLADFNSFVYDGNTWAATSGVTGVAVHVGYLQFIGGATSSNKVVTLANALTTAQNVVVRFKARSSVAGTVLTFGSQFGTTTGTATKTATLTTTDAYYEGAVLNNSVNLVFGIVQATQAQADVFISEIYVLVPSNLATRVTAVEVLAGGAAVTPQPSYTGNNVTMDLPNDWVGGVGGTSWYTKNAGNITMNIPGSTSVALSLSNKLVSGTIYTGTIKANASVAGMKLHFGSAFSTSTTSAPDAQKIITLALGDNEILVKFTANSTNVWLGSASGDASPAGVIVLDNLTMLTFSELAEKITNLEVKQAAHEISFGTESFLTSMSRNEKPYELYTFEGDSILANQGNVAVPSGIFEGEGRFPLMMGSNNLPRRAYDRLSWNKPQYYNIWHSAVVKTGTWVDDKAAVVNRPQTLDHYMRASTGATAAIPVPAGVTNIAIFCRKTTTAGVSLAVTLDGVAISVGDANPTLTDTYTTAFHIQPYTGLASSGVIRSLSIAVTGTAHIHGVAMWTGNTLFIQNVARGGHTLGDLKPFFGPDVLNNKPSSVFFEVTELNNVRVPVATTQADLNYYIDLLKDIDHCWYTPHAMGVDPTNPATNHYANNLDPSQEEVNKVVIQTLWDRKEPTLNGFEAYRKKMIRRNGTLMGGQQGSWYTEDGQHLAALGYTLTDELIRYLEVGKPITFA